MSAPPVDKESNTISMAVPIFSFWGQQRSPAHRLNGYPWRLRLVRGSDRKKLSLALQVICDKSTESELWECTAIVTFGVYQPKTLKFSSWGKQEHVIKDDLLPLTNVNVLITTNNNGERWRRRPSLPANNDAILSIGEEKRRIYVNKELLSSQSPYFDRLFNGDFKERNMREIPIGEVDLEEFHNILRMLYGTTACPLTMDNIYNVLELADRFELKIVQDRAVSFLLHPNRVPKAQLILISQQYNIPVLMEIVLSQYTDSTAMRDLSGSPEWKQLSHETISAIFERSCALGPSK